jgi:general secretion pathway protein H
MLMGLNQSSKSVCGLSTLVRDDCQVFQTQFTVWEGRSARRESFLISQPGRRPEDASHSHHCNQTVGQERTVTQGTRNKGSQNQAAFSLLELLVVLMLLALVTAVIVPSLGRVLSTAKLKTSSREIAASIRLARSKAVSEQQVYLLGFDLEKNEVKLSSLNSTYRKSFELPDGIHLVRASLLETRVEPEAKDPFFYFMPNGNSQSFQVSLRNEQGRALRVIHNNLKGTPIVDDDSSSQNGPSN